MKEHLFADFLPNRKLFSILRSEVSQIKLNTNAKFIVE